MPRSFARHPLIRLQQHLRCTLYDSLAHFRHLAPSLAYPLLDMANNGQNHPQSPVLDPRENFYNDEFWNGERQLAGQAGHFSPTATTQRHNAQQPQHNTTGAPVSNALAPRYVTYGAPLSSPTPRPTSPLSPSAYLVPSQTPTHAHASAPHASRANQQGQSIADRRPAYYGPSASERCTKCGAMRDAERCNACWSKMCASSHWSGMAQLSHYGQVPQAEKDRIELQRRREEQQHRSKQQQRQGYNGTPGTRNGGYGNSDWEYYGSQ